MSKKKPILIVAGEPFSVFTEILFKTFKKHKLKKPLVIIGSYKLFKKQMDYLNYKISFNNINENFNIKDLNINKINIINIELNFSKPFQMISDETNPYNKKSFQLLYLFQKTALLF